MKKHIGWSYAPYQPLLMETDLYICRLIPSKDHFLFDWIDDGSESYTVFLRRRGEEAFTTVATIRGSGKEKTQLQYIVTNLEADIDYEFYLSAGTKTSAIRLVHTGDCPGTPVNYLHPDDKAFIFSGHSLCSPCIVRHPDGFLLASMDVMMAESPMNLELIYRSDDEGKTWHYVSELFPCFWGRMFIHNGILYMISASTEYGDLLIGASTDGGKTFTEPTILLRGTNGKAKMPGVHKNTQPVVEYNGRLYFTLEWGNWGLGYHAAMIASVPCNCDLLDAQNWNFTYPLPYNPNWEGVAEGPSSGTIEGTLAVAPDGKLYSVMRYDMSKTKERYGLVLRYRVNTEDPDAQLEYDRAIPFPANNAKFEIQRDPVTGLYFSIADRITTPEHFYERTRLALMASKDMIHWVTVCNLIDGREEDPVGKKIGFQYVDFLIEGEDILFLCRTAYNQAANFHDSNYITFHRVSNFRSLLSKISESDFEKHEI